MKDDTSDSKPRTRIRVDIPRAESSNSSTSSAKDEPPSEHLPPPAEHLLFAGETYCRNHRHSLASYYCRKCHRYFCDLCVAPRPLEGALAHCCRLCGQPCQAVTTALMPSAEEPFRTLAFRAFRYPFVGDGAFMVLSGTLFLFLLDALSWVSSFAGLLGAIAGIILAVFGGGYLFALVKSVVLTSAQGSDCLPNWPDISDVTGDMVVPFLQSILLLAVCLGPGLVLLAVGDGNGDGRMVLGGEVLVVLGLCYLPMALLGIAMFDSVLGINPMLGIPSIAQTAGHYSLCLCVFFLIMGVGIGLDFLFTKLIPVPILPSVISAFFTFCALMILARTMGLLFRVNEDALGWFKPKNC